MFTGFCFGVAFCLAVQFGIRLAVRAWRPTPYRLPPQPPRTAAQLANERVFDDLEQYHPRIVSAHFQRRTRRGRRRGNVER